MTLSLLAGVALALGSQPPPIDDPAGERTAEPARSVELEPAARLPVPYPHPLITEILYAVPTGPDGDANLDGKRDAAGDEFIELVNPHDRPINLRGYRLTDRNEPDKGQLKFVFPAVELPPGAVVVVFNGYEAKWEGPVGDARRAPAAAHDRFAGALVFTMKAGSSMTSWANGGDWALLTDPAGNPVQCIWWGKFNEKLPEGPELLIEQGPLVTRTSIARDGAGDHPWVAHIDIDEALFSPGRWTGRPVKVEQPTPAALSGEPAAPAQGGEGAEEPVDGRSR